MNSTELYAWMTGGYAGLLPPVIHALVLPALLMFAACGHSARVAQENHTLQDFFAVDGITPIGFEMNTPIDAYVHATQRYTYVTPRTSASIDTLTLYRISHATNAIDSLYLPMPADSLLNRRGTLKDFAVDDERICLLFWRALVIYERDHATGTPVRSSVVGLRYPYSTLRLFGDSCIISISSLANREYSSEYTWATAIDLSSGANLWERSLPDPDGVQFTSFIPRRVIDCSRDEIAVADVVRYRIRLYNHQGETITSLERQPRAWSAISDTGYRNYLPPTGPVPFNPKAQLDSLRPYIASASMIRLIDFINDTTLMVAWQSTEQYDRGILKDRSIIFFDIWRKFGGAWDLLAGDVRDFNPMPADTFPTPGMLDWSYSCTGAGSSYIYKLTPLPPIPLEKRTFAEISSALEEYLMEHDLRFSLIRFRARDELGEPEAME